MKNNMKNNIKNNNINNINNINNNDNYTNKEMADLFNGLYNSCLNYKYANINKKSKQNINCDEYNEQFKFFSEEYYKGKYNK